MGVHKKGGLVGGFDQLRAPDAPTISVSAGDQSVTVTITNPSDVGGGSITSYAVSALTGPIEDTTFAVTVVSSGGNKYAIDGTTQGTVTLHKGHTYIFDQSDSSNSGHPLRLSTTSNGSHGGGSEYTTGVTTSGTPGSAGAFTKIVVDSGAASTLYYYCSSHSGMGGSATVKTSLQGGASGSSSPITVSSLTNDEAYNVRASAINAFGQSPYSVATSTSPVPPKVYWLGRTTVNVHTSNITTLGNTTDWGYAMRYAEYFAMTGSSSTRAVQCGYDASTSAVDSKLIEKLNLVSAGAGTNFGELNVDSAYAGAGVSNGTRFVFTIGYAPSSVVDTIEYVTIASEGNASDFGNMLVQRYILAGCASPTRGVISGGQTGAGQQRNTIDYITIASTGNTTDFGDLAVARNGLSSCSSSTRGIISGGDAGSGQTDHIEYITIASAGNSTDFGDLINDIRYHASGCSETRALIAGEYVSNSNGIEYITIASTGNAQDFGDLLNNETNGLSCASNAHGGLQ